MWAGRAARWPKQPPATREYYLLRSIFEEHFPSPCALATVPMARPLPSSTAAPMRRLVSRSSHCLAHTCCLSLTGRAGACCAGKVRRARRSSTCSSPRVMSMCHVRL